MNNFLRKFERKIATNTKLFEFYSKLKDNNNYLELEETLENRIVVTDLQANLGGFIGECLVFPNMFPTMIMSTMFPSTPLCTIDREDLLSEIVSPELLKYPELMDKILMRSKAIKGFLSAGKTFIVFYIKDYSNPVMENLHRLSDLYPTLILKKVDTLPDDLHGMTYIVNEKNDDLEHIFLASVITAQCGQALRDNLRLSKIFIKNCTDEDFMNKLSKLNNLLTANGVNLASVINLEKAIAG